MQKSKTETETVWEYEKEIEQEGTRRKKKGNMTMSPSPSPSPSPCTIVKEQSSPLTRVQEAVEERIKENNRKANEMMLLRTNNRIKPSLNRGPTSLSSNSRWMQHPPAPTPATSVVSSGHKSGGARIGDYAVSLHLAEATDASAVTTTTTTRATGNQQIFDLSFRKRQVTCARCVRAVPLDDNQTHFI